MSGRDLRGERSAGRDQHSDLCDGLDCPCYLEGYKLGKLHGTQDAAGYLLRVAEKIRGGHHHPDLNDGSS